MRTDAVFGAGLLSSQRHVAYSFQRRQAPRFATMRLDGTHRRVFRRDWGPKAWSPDGRRVLVGRGSRIALLNPRTGTLRQLGSLPAAPSARPSGRRMHP